MLDVDVETVHRYENGQEHIGAARLWQVAEKLETNIHHFFMGINVQSSAEVIPFPKRATCDGRTR
jgi:hypothetical protein